MKRSRKNVATIPRDLTCMLRNGGLFLSHYLVKNTTQAGLHICKKIPNSLQSLKCHSTSKPAFQYPSVNSCINWAHLQQATTMRRRKELWPEISWINQIFESLVLLRKMPNFAKEADLGQIWLHCSMIKINCNHATNGQKSVGYHLVPPKPHISKSRTGRRISNTYTFVNWEWC